MQSKLNDSSLFSHNSQNITSITLNNELNDNYQQNNLNLLNHSSSYSDTDNSIIKTDEQPTNPNLNNSNITVVDNQIQLSSQNTSQENQFNTNNYASSNEINNTATRDEGYSTENGYGLVNAAEAVAEVTGEDTFEEVPDTGGKNWGADAVNAPEVWAQGYTGQGVVVAVLDTGVDYNHNDLKNNIWTNSVEIANNGIDDDGNGYIDDFYGWNFDGDNNNTIDVQGHGTHVSGTIAGTKNDFGVTGIAYDAQIMPVKVLDDFGSGSNTSVANGIRYAADNGADVINLSLGSSFPSSRIEEAIEYATSKGAIVVMASGNSGGSAPIYPARYADEYGIAVGAIDEDKNMAQFSNRAGSEPLTYVTAPGVDIYSTLPNNRYDSYSGTSMATPHVAGVVALMLSANPNLNSKVISQTLEETSSNNIQTGTGEDDFLTFIQNINLESIFNSEFIKDLIENFDFSNTTTLTSSPDINKSVNQSLESKFINYQENTLGNRNNQFLSSNLESMLEEPEILLQYKSSM